MESATTTRRELFALNNANFLCYGFALTMTVNTPPTNLAFELEEAVRHLSKSDQVLKALIAEM
ncbi:MAG TPA: hypothetical protein VEF05_00425, partial [Terriglobales bacterium]|nr:hypothetical protein [Terriglobales bacterium]